MRKRLRQPRIYRRGKWFCFRITSSLGKREVIKSFSQKEAVLKRNEYITQLFSLLSGSPSYRIGIEQAIEFWLDYKKPRVDNSSFLRYAEMMNNFKEYFSELQPLVKFIDEIKPDHINEFVNYRLEKGTAPKTVNDERQRISNLYDVLIEYNKASDNPAAKVKPLKYKKNTKRRVLTDEELSKLFKEAKAESRQIDWYAIYVTFYMTGARRDELRTLKKEYVDLENGWIYFPDTKTDVPKNYPIHPELRPVLKEAIKKSAGGLVFPGEEGKMLGKNKMRDKMLQLCKRAGIAKATLHDLRHTWTTVSQHKGISADVVQKLGGWKDRKTMEQTYTHAPVDEYIKNEYFKISYIPKIK